MNKSQFDKDYDKLKKTAKAGAALLFFKLLYALWLDFPKKTKWAVGRWWVVFLILRIIDTWIALPWIFFGFRKPIIINREGNKIPSIFQGLKELFSFKSYTSILWVVIFGLMLIMIITQALGIA